MDFALILLINLIHLNRFKPVLSSLNRFKSNFKKIVSDNNRSDITDLQPRQTSRRRVYQFLKDGNTKLGS